MSERYNEVLSWRPRRVVWSALWVTGGVRKWCSTSAVPQHSKRRRVRKAVGVASDSTYHHKAPCGNIDGSCALRSHQYCPVTRARGQWHTGDHHLRALAIAGANGKVVQVGPEQNVRVDLDSSQLRGCNHDGQVSTPCACVRGGTGPSSPSTVVHSRVVFLVDSLIARNCPACVHARVCCAVWWACGRGEYVAVENGVRARPTLHQPVSPGALCLHAWWKRKRSA